jgi:hypothetical protein
LRVVALLTLPDPNAPKRGLSAYMFFANDQRDKVREDNPGIKFGTSSILLRPLPILTFLGEVGKMLGEKWKALNEKQRQPYDAKAAADKKRYEAEKEAYAVSCVYPSDATIADTTYRTRLRRKKRRRSPSKVALFFPTKLSCYTTLSLI